MGSFPNQQQAVGRAIRERLAHSLNLRSNEQRPVALLWAHSFFLGVGVAYLISAALPIFLASFPIAYLPGAFASAAILELLINYFSERLEHALGQVRMLRLVLLLLVAGTVFVLLLIKIPSPIPPLAIAFGLLVWSRILIFVSQNEFWGLPLHLFDVRQGKRLFSLIDSGSFLAKILGYFSVPLLITFMSVPDLLILSALGTATSILVLQKIIAGYAHLMVQHPTSANVTSKPEFNDRDHANAKQHSAMRSSLEFLWRDKYLTSIALVAFLALFAMTCIDFGFLSEIEEKYESAAEIAKFIGLFLGAAKLASLILKVGFVGRLFGRFGLARTSVVLPIGLFAITSVGLALSKNSVDPAMIWAFIGAMLLVELWSEAVQAPALVVAVQPLNKHAQHIGHDAIGGIVEPLALGAAATTLYILSVSIGISLRGISFTMLGIFIAWAGTVLWFGREYKSTVLRAMKHRRLKSSELVWNSEARHMIENALHSSRAIETEYAIHLIPVSEAAFFLEVFPHLLGHPEHAVRLAALTRFEEFEWPETEQKRAAEILGRLLTRNTDSSEILGQALRVYTSVRPDLEAEDLKDWLNDERLPVREGLLAGLIKHKGIDGVLVAGEFVQSMVRSADPHERASAAEIVGRVGVRQFYHSLLALLTDDNAAVRLAAIRASGRVAHPHLIEPILDLYLRNPPTIYSAAHPAEHVSYRQRQIAVEKTLRKFGNAIIPHLASRIESGQVDSEHLQRIARLLGHWGIVHHERNPEHHYEHKPWNNPVFVTHAVQLLTSFLEWPVTHPSPGYGSPRILGSLRLAALNALTSNGITVNDTALLTKLMFEELERSRVVISTLHSIDTQNSEPEKLEAAQLLRSTLSHEITQSVERILLLLELQYDAPTVRRVRDSLIIGDDLHRATAFEVLEHLLPTEHAKKVIPLLEARLVLGRRKLKEVTLADIIPSDVKKSLSSESSLRKLVTDQDRFYEPWTTAVALYYAGLHVRASIIEALERAATRTDIAGDVARMLVQHPSETPATIKKDFRNEFYHYTEEGEPMPHLFERVILLKTVDLFLETPDPVLSHIAQALEEIHVAAGEHIIEKGETGSCLYIIAEGRVSVHDGATRFSELSSRDVVGEMALLDPEPRSASVTALEETTLLKLDREVFYDLMVDNIEIARGAITTLCRRIRKQNELARTPSKPS